MTTTAFRNVRALNQLCSVLLIVINIPLPFLLVPYMLYVSVEGQCLKTTLSILTIFKTTSMVNITLGLFASCGINSKVRLYMRLYLLVGVLLLIGMSGIILYVKISYQSDVSKALGVAYNIAQAENIILHYLECSNQKTCTAQIMSTINDIRYYYLIISIPSVLLNLLNILLARIALCISIEHALPKPPSFVEKNRVGMNTVSLRNRRVLSASASNALNS
ncbi:hypothetical protein CWI42_100520 [Ordospora colligata]|uniref:Uncharacterized protein n=1 Tax=Ordospora colligata OC4 TaxID=1354746 RepID=A0A0B2UIJ9_9MICR|nr:uncharacterized protein M896_100530 [Ordospora colligata OC4]KHN69069.1 hypothetical protein M896_100530 [Ordospora colligata OC4]TBU14350.1 hypothetical protein CWI40_100540 [Ordospora colligata]TBU14415.1 hypothetical protein CWI41_100540 [Ordospora colligata]TBU17931.1 hypothetical protein CWI42_100520 [Ordospora colligata]